MDKKIIDNVIKKKYLFRGTNDFYFNLRKKQGFYYGITQNQELLTSTSTVLINALIAGINRCNTMDCQQRNAKPVLLAINSLNYINSMQSGLEPEEIEIKGKINLNDIIVIDSLDKLVKTSESLKNPEIEKFNSNYI